MKCKESKLKGRKGNERKRQQRKRNAMQEKTRLIQMGDFFREVYASPAS